MLFEAERAELAYVLVKNLDASIVRAPPSLLIERNSGGECVRRSAVDRAKSKDS